MDFKEDFLALIKGYHLKESKHSPILELMEASSLDNQKVVFAQDNKELFLRSPNKNKIKIILN
jgi:hypothetical protein